MSREKLVASNTLFQVVGKFVGAGSMFVVSVLIARAFGIDAYGDFVKVTTYVALFYLLADFGMNAVYLRDTDATQVSDYDRWPILLGLRFVLGIGLSFVSIALLAFLPTGTTSGYTHAVRLGIILFSPTIIFQALLTSANAVFQKHLRYDYSAIATSAGSLVGLLLVWLVALVFTPLVGIHASLLSLGSGSLIGACVSLVCVRRLGVSLAPLIDRKNLVSLLVQSLPLGMTLLFNLVYFRIDSVILTLTRSTAEVGVYGLAYKIFELPLVLPTFFMNAMYPLLLKARADEFRRLTKKSFWVLTFSSLGLVVCIWNIAPYVSWIRPEFEQSIPALRILGLGLPLFFVSSLTMWMLITQKRNAALLAIYGAGMIFNIATNALFVPTHGYIAASWITLATELVILLLSLLQILPLIRTPRAQ